jgi:hypothetical protein
MTDAYMDLEPQIRDLVQMAELARCYVSRLPVISAEAGEKAAAERICFAVSHIADMANALEKAWDEGLPSGKRART